MTRSAIFSMSSVDTGALWIIGRHSGAAGHLLRDVLTVPKGRMARP